MAKISADQIGLRDAADVFGISVDTLRRRIRDNEMDEAVLAQGPFGATWVLPREALGVIADREGWSTAGTPPAPPPLQVPVSRDTAPKQTSQYGAGLLAPAARSAEASPLVQSVQKESVSTSISAAAATAAEAGGSAPLARATHPIPGASAAPSSAQPVIDLTGSSGNSTPPNLVSELSAVIAREVSSALADNVEAELTRVRDAITQAEVRAVSAEARVDSMRGEHGRLQAQLKRAEADAEYWRSQHDRLNRDLDRERGSREAAESARAVADALARTTTTRNSELSIEAAEAIARERELIAERTLLANELDQANVAMGWWSRRKYRRIQSLRAERTQPGLSSD